VTTRTQPDDINPELMVGLLWVGQGPDAPHAAAAPGPRPTAHTFLTSSILFGVRSWPWMQDSATNRWLCSRRGGQSSFI